MSLLRSECSAMSGSNPAKPLAYLPNFTARKVQAVPGGLPTDVPDSLAAWATRYLALAVVGVRSPAVTQKIALHLDRFIASFQASYGHDRAQSCACGIPREYDGGLRRERRPASPRHATPRDGADCVQIGWHAERALAVARGGG